jgi:hypothetical protein
VLEVKPIGAGGDVAGFVRWVLKVAMRRFRLRCVNVNWDGDTMAP